MPKARTRSGSSKNVAASSSASATPAPLLDGLLGQMQISAPVTVSTKPSVKSMVQSKDKAKTSNSQSNSMWQYNDDDWPDKAAADSETDAFPSSLRAIERKNERARDKVFRIVPETINESQDKLISEQETKIETPLNRIPSVNINVIELSSIVADLMAGTRDKVAFEAFLEILQHFSVRSPRDDHLEETVYHLIQAGVSFIRAHEQRFDLEQLQECYRQRHTNKATV